MENQEIQRSQSSVKIARNATTNIIKLRFTNNGEPHGREYAYYTPAEVAVGDIVEFETRDGIAKGMVTQVNVPEKEIAPFKDRAKTIIGKVQMDAKADKPNCYECKHRGSVPGDRHSCCNYPGNDTGILSFFAQENRENAKKLNIKAQPHGISMGWFMWPVNFDPVWLIECDGFAKKGGNTSEAATTKA